MGILNEMIMEPRSELMIDRKEKEKKKKHYDDPLLLLLLNPEDRQQQQQEEEEEGKYGQQTSRLEDMIRPVSRQQGNRKMMDERNEIVVSRNGNGSNRSGDDENDNDEEIVEDDDDEKKENIRNDKITHVDKEEESEDTDKENEDRNIVADGGGNNKNDGEDHMVGCDGGRRKILVMKSQPSMTATTTTMARLPIVHQRSQTVKRGRRPMDRIKSCSNCHTTETTSWRMSCKKEPLCNACALYLKLYGESRPEHMWGRKPTKRNRRKSSTFSNEEDHSTMMMLESMSSHDNNSHEGDHELLMRLSGCSSFVRDPVLTRNDLIKNRHREFVSCSIPNDPMTTMKMSKTATMTIRMASRESSSSIDPQTTLSIAEITEPRTTGSEFSGFPRGFAYELLKAAAVVESTAATTNPSSMSPPQQPPQPVSRMDESPVQPLFRVLPSSLSSSSCSSMTSKSSSSLPSLSGTNVIWYCPSSTPDKSGGSWIRHTTNGSSISLLYSHDEMDTSFTSGFSNSKGTHEKLVPFISLGKRPTEMSMHDQHLDRMNQCRPVPDHNHHHPPPPRQHPTPSYQQPSQQPQFPKESRILRNLQESNHLTAAEQQQHLHPHGHAMHSLIARNNLDLLIECALAECTGPI